MKKYPLILCIALLGLFLACKKPKENTPTTGFDTKAMLTNIGNNIIIPSYQSLQAREKTFDSLVTVFNASTSLSDFTNMQEAFKELYEAWQLCSPFELGKADETNLNLNLNTFPTDTNKVNANIAAGTYDLNIVANLSAKGFPALDYLLFSDSYSAFFTNDANAAKRKQYLLAISADIKTRIAEVVNAWSASGGNYINTFINADGLDVGSSIGLLINKMDYDFEILKNNKLGIPLGKQSMGTPYPEKTEGYYCRISTQLAVAQLDAIERLFRGSTGSVDGLGLDDYLAQVNGQVNGGTLSGNIKQQFYTARSALYAVGDPLAATILHDPGQANSAYVEVQKLLVLLKTDMPSSMGVLITYVDNDGD